TRKGTSVHTATPSPRPRTMLAASAALAVGLLGLTACAPEGEAGPETTPESLTLLTHDSFALSDGVLEQFTADTGIAVEVLRVDDAGALVNQLVLTKDSPLGDVAFGVDNTFASRAISAGVFAEHRTAA